MTRQIKHQRQMKNERYRERFDFYKAGSRNMPKVIIDTKGRQIPLKNLTVNQINRIFVAKLKQVQKGQKEKEVEISRRWGERSENVILKIKVVFPRDAEYLEENDKLPSHIQEQIKNIVNEREKQVNKNTEILKLNEGLIKAVMVKNMNKIEKLGVMNKEVGKKQSKNRDEQDELMEKRLEELQKKTGKVINDKNEYEIKELIRNKDKKMIKLREEDNKLDDMSSKIDREMEKLGYSSYHSTDKKSLMDIRNWDEIIMNFFTKDETGKVVQERMRSEHIADEIRNLETFDRKEKYENFEDDVERKLRDYLYNRQDRKERAEERKLHPQPKKPRTLKPEEVEKLL